MLVGLCTSQAALDETLDLAGALVNLRTAISRYRKPRRRFRFFRCAHLTLRPSRLDA